MSLGSLIPLPLFLVEGHQVRVDCVYLGELGAIQGVLGGGTWARGIFRGSWGGTMGTTYK